MKFICNLSKVFIGKIVDSIYDAVTDDITMDIRSAGLTRDKMNSYPSRVWDLINRNILSTFDSDDMIVANCTSCGPWKLVAIFDKSSGMLITIMREERFLDVKKDKNNIHHYVAHLTQMFNLDLQSCQQTMFEPESDEAEVKQSIQRICDDLLISPEMITHHAMVLFSATNENLHSIRCVMINRHFEECESISWNEFIRVGESVIVEQIEPINVQANMPDRGLKFTAKAKKKQGQNTSISHKVDESESTQLAK
jgi:hypothetical protein